MIQLYWPAINIYYGHKQIGVNRSKNDVNKTLIHDLVHEHQIFVIGNSGRLQITPRRMAFVFSDWIDWNMKYGAFRA